MLNTYAERVRFVRSLTKLSRELFEQKHGINKNTLKSWELGVNPLTEKSAKAFSEAINAEGFSCTPLWLIFGQGSEPRLITQEEDNLLEKDIDQQSKIIYEADYFKKNNPNSVVCMIPDSSMSPEFNPGDYVGGINVDFACNLNDRNGRTYIITLNNKIIIVRKILLAKNEQFILSPTNPQYAADIVKSDDIVNIASIIWHRITFT